MHCTSRIVLLITGIFFVCFSQDINISGTVTDSGGAGIEGAVVQLEKLGFKDTTGANGNFTITGDIVIIGQLNQPFTDRISANIQNNSLSINLEENSDLEIITYNLQGKEISLIRKRLNPGIHSIKFPCIGSGVYFHKIKTGKQELLLKSNSVGNMSFGTVSSIKKFHTTIKTSRIQYQIDDVIKASKSGYLHYRVGITNSDTSGIEIKMISQDAGTVTDIDGNVYHAIRLGNQIWTVENLRVTHYTDGTPIPKITDDAEWSACSTGTAAYCYYNNDSIANAEKYGALYNWHAVNNGELAPAGWHVPTEAEWDKLQNYLIANGYNWDGTTTGNKIGKSMAAKTDWNTSDKEGSVGNDLSTNNSSGFSALPGGYRGPKGSFVLQGDDGTWWGTTESGASNAYNCELFHYEANLYGSYYDKDFGFFVRLLRD